MELPEVGNESGLSSLRFFLGPGVTTGSAAASTDDSELDSESESESEVSSATFSSSSSAFRFCTDDFESSSNFICALALSLACRSALSRSYFSFPVCEMSVKGIF